MTRRAAQLISLKFLKFRGHAKSDASALAVVTGQGDHIFVIQGGAA